MKKIFKSMNRESGFILPLTILTITIVLFALITLVLLYEQEVVMTANIKGQFIIESLFSLAAKETETSFSENEPLPELKTYVFSDGKVTVSYHPTNVHFRIFYDIETNNGARYSLYQMYVWSID